VPSDLDKDVRKELLSLSREVADLVARHLVAAGQIIDEDADLALAHATAARRMASRIAVVREAVGLAAYAVGDWAAAIAELRTYHRMSGLQTHVAVLADCERALGRPERAIDLFRSADRDKLDKEGAIELLIVAAGARGDLGQFDAAVAMLQVKELTAEGDAAWAARLRYAYADALLAANRRDEAREWFSRAAAADDDNLTDAAERLLELDGVSIEGDDQDDDDEQSDDVESQDGRSQGRESQSREFQGVESKGESDVDEFVDDDIDDIDDDDDDEDDLDEDEPVAATTVTADPEPITDTEIVHLDDDPDAPFVSTAPAKPAIADETGTDGGGVEDTVVADVDAGIDEPATDDVPAAAPPTDDELADEVTAVEGGDTAKGQA
jgi:tetratricopeptide (TPR) repeat protein